MPTLRCRHITSPLPLITAMGELIPAAPQSYIQQLIKKGKILVNGSVADRSTALSAADSIQLPNNARLLQLIETSHIDIVLETEHYFIIHKPSGLAIHPRTSEDDDNLRDRLTTLVKRRGELYGIFPVNRLDIDTSGLVVMAKGKSSASTLGTMLMDNSVEKEYLSIVEGTLDDSGVIDMPIMVEGKEKEAKTCYTTLSATKTHSLLKLKLETGRKHQIRIHLKQKGAPLAGDRRYNPKSKAPRMMLHSCRLAFTDPFSKNIVDLFENPSESFLQYAKTSGLNYH